MQIVQSKNRLIIKGEKVCTIENLEISNHVENKYIENRKYMMIIAGTETRGQGVTFGIYNISLVLMNGVESIHIYIIYTIRTPN